MPVHAGRQQAADAARALHGTGEVFAPDEEVGGEARRGRRRRTNNFRDEVPAVVDVGGGFVGSPFPDASRGVVVGVGDGNDVVVVQNGVEAVLRVPAVMRVAVVSHVAVGVVCELRQ